MSLEEFTKDYSKIEPIGSSCCKAPIIGSREDLIQPYCSNCYEPIKSTDQDSIT
jgi:hypothetical protein